MPLWSSDFGVLSQASCCPAPRAHAQLTRKALLYEPLALLCLHVQPHEVMNLVATPAPGEDTLQLDFCEQFDLRTPGAAKGAAYAGAATSTAAFDCALQHMLAARPQLCTASEVQRVL